MANHLNVLKYEEDILIQIDLINIYIYKKVNK